MNGLAAVPGQASPEAVWRRAALFQELGQTLLGAPDVPAVFDAAAAGLRRAIDCDMVVIVAHSQDYSAATVVAVSAEHPTHLWKGYRYQYQPEEVPLVRETLTPALVEDISAVPGDSPLLQRLAEEGAVSLLNVPIVHRGRSIGSFNATGSRERPLPEEALLVAQDLTLLLTLALESHQLLEERAAGEAALAASSRRLEVAARATGVALWEHRMREPRIWASEAWYAQMGCDPREWKADVDTFIDHVHPADRERVRRTIGEFLSSADDQVEYEFRPAGANRWLYVLGRMERDESGRPAVVTGIQLDITARKQAEEALRASLEEIRSLSRRLELVRERERADLAREIHDEVGQMITALSLDLAWLRRRVGPTPAGDGNTEEVDQRLQQMQELLRSSLDAVRRLSANLHPRMLDELGLAAALRWLAGEFERRSEIQCRTDLPDTRMPLDALQRTALFRIAQEALTNVSRHSGADLVEIRLVSSRCAVRLEIADNGRGLGRTGPAAGRSGQGIAGMRERAVLLEGSLRVTRRRRGGTRVSVSIPVHPPESAPD